MGTWEFENNMNRVEWLVNACQPDENGELPENIEELESEIEQCLGESVDMGTEICRQYKLMEATAAACKAEAKRMTEKAKRLEARMERVMECMKRVLGDKKAAFGAYEYAPRKTVETLHYTNGWDEAKLIDNLREMDAFRYIRAKFTEDINVPEVKAAMKAGEIAFDGVELQHGMSYKIK